MTLHYVSIKEISDEKLEVLGYIAIDENEHTKTYYHFGEEMIVDKADPFIYVDDINDARSLGSEAIVFPAQP